MAHEVPSDVALPPRNAVCLVLGGAGFIGSHLAAELMRNGRNVVVVDTKPCLYMKESEICTMFIAADLRERAEAFRACNMAAQAARSDGGEVWAFLLAADMGGMGFIAGNDSNILLHNTAITANVVAACRAVGVCRLFVASSACVYPTTLQDNAAATTPLAEDDAWPAQPQDGYGLEKLYGEEMAMQAGKASKGELQVRIARFHNVYGPHGTWIGGREKAPAAFLRKALFLHHLAARGDTNSLEIWGNGKQTRTFCYVSDAVAGILALTSSDVDTPINIGSDEVVTVQELALMAGEAVGWQRPELERLVTTTDGPIGVNARSADLTKASRALNWRPTVLLSEGLLRTASWMRREVEQLQTAVEGVGGADAWNKFLRDGLRSVQGAHDEMKRFGLLVPVTSRARGREVGTGVRHLLQSLSRTMSYGWQYNVIFGVDAGDAVCDPTIPDAIDLCQLVREELPLASEMGTVTARVRVFSYPPGSICHIWSDLAADSFASGDHLAVLLGDDVVLTSADWADAVWKGFEQIANTTGFPTGFGCVAFADDAFPGFPTFPVLHRTHAEVFSGCIIPRAFHNQDADPFLFQVYRAFGAACMAPDARLENTIGGAADARYSKAHIPWTGDILRSARHHAAQWLERRGFTPRMLTLDVVVPTYRVPDGVLRRILSMPVPRDVSTQFTIICDNPDSAAATATITALQLEHRDNPMVRIRTNKSNLGAGLTRNRGLDESAADWVLFLDDDVEPSEDILGVYAAAIRAHPRATGFIGISVLPQPQTGRQAGVLYAGVAFFWTAASTFPHATDLPWGVTANLCVRRPPQGSVQFRDVFPRTGGGEDIDFCLRLREYVRQTVPRSEGFVATPSAVIHHPWWDGGSPRFSHFSGWASGDGHLIDLFPHLSYYNAPELSEILLVLSCVLLVQLTAAASVWLAQDRGYTVVALVMLVSPHSIACTIAVAVACMVSDLIYDAYAELASPRMDTSHLGLTTRAWGIVQGLVVRTVSEHGRLLGHACRGRLWANFCKRFNWFGEMWPGAPAVERERAFWRCALRIACSAAAVAFLRSTAS